MRQVRGNARTPSPAGASRASVLLVLVGLSVLVAGLIGAAPALASEAVVTRPNPTSTSAALPRVSPTASGAPLRTSNGAPSSGPDQQEPGPAQTTSDPASPSRQLEPEPLRPRRWSRDPASIARQAADTVAGQLDAYPRLASHQERARRAAERVLYLQPFEFLVWVWFDRRPAIRDHLLELYHRQPDLALRELSALGLWPSQRAELLARTPAQYDPDDDRVLVNLGSTDEQEAYSVLVHELWHATPELRARTNPDGDGLLTTGFWSKRWDRRQEAWLPVEHSRGLVFEPWLLDEAMAYRLERAGTRREPQTHERVRGAAAFLDRVEELIGPERLLDLYLSSDDDGFMAEILARRPLLAEYFDGVESVAVRS